MGNGVLSFRVITPWIINCKEKKEMPEQSYGTAPAVGKTGSRGLQTEHSGNWHITSLGFFNAKKLAWIKRFHKISSNWGTVYEIWKMCVTIKKKTEGRLQMKENERRSCSVCSWLLDPRFLRHTQYWEAKAGAFEFKAHLCFTGVLGCSSVRAHLPGMCKALALTLRPSNENNGMYH